MSTREYIGARYVPLFADPIEWDNSISYEPLTVVTYQGGSYVSKQSVPVGIDIENTTYWLLWADYNAQIEAYRQEVLAFDGRIEALENDLPSTDFDSTHTVSDALDGVRSLLPSTDFDSSHTVKDYVNSQLLISNIPVGYIGIGRTTVNTIPHYIYSPDMKSFIDYGEIDDMTFNDSSNLTKYGDYYYDVSNNGYNYSKDFVNWTYVAFPFSNPNIAGGPIWGTKFCWDVKGTNYCFTSFKYSNTDIAGSYGDEPAFHVYYSEITQNDDGTISFGQFNLFAPLNQNATNSYIDPAVCVDPVSGDVLFVAKDELEKKPVVYKGSTLLSVTAQLYYNQIAGIEAYQLFATGRQVFMIGQVYNLHLGQGGIAYPRHYVLIILMNNGVYNNIPKATVISQSSDFRHIDFIPIDEISINALKNRAPLGIPVLYPSSGRNDFDYGISSTDDFYLYNIPNFMVSFSAGSYTADIYYKNCYNNIINVVTKIGTGTHPTINKHDNIDGNVSFPNSGNGAYQIIPYNNNSYGTLTATP